MANESIYYGDITFGVKIDPKSMAEFTAEVERQAKRPAKLPTPISDADKAKLRSFIADYKDLEVQFRRTGVDATGTATKMRVLANNIDQQRASISRTSPLYAAYSNAINTASSAADRLEGKVGKLSFANQINLGISQRAVASLQSFGPAGTIAGGALGLVSNSMGFLSKESLGVSVSLNQALGLLRALPAVAAVAGPAITLLAVASLKKLTDEAANFADEIEQAGLRAQLTTTTVQELQFVADIAGGSFGDVETAIKGMNARLKGAEEGSDKQSAAFARLGVATKDANGELLSSEVIFLDAIKNLQGIENETQRNISAQAIFGKSASNLNPILSLSAEEFGKLRKEANDLGLVMDAQSIGALATYKDKIETVEKQFRLARFEISSAFLPVLTEGLIPILQNALIPFLQTSADKLSGLTTRFFETSDAGDTMRGSVAGNIATLATFGTRLFAIGEIATGLVQILLAPFAALGSALGTISVELEVFGRGFQAISEGNWQGVADAFKEMQAVDSTLFTGIQDSFVAQAQAGAATTGAGFNLLLLDEAGLAASVKTFFDAGTVAVETNKRNTVAAASDAGYEVGGAVADGITSATTNAVSKIDEAINTYRNALDRFVLERSLGVFTDDLDITQGKLSATEKFIDSLLDNYAYLDTAQQKQFTDAITRRDAYKEEIKAMQDAQKQAEDFNKFFNQFDPNARTTQGRPTQSGEYGSGRSSTIIPISNTNALGQGAALGILSPAEKFLQEYNGVNNALALLGLDEKNIQATAKKVAETLPKILEGIRVADYLQQRETVQNALALLGLDDRNIQQTAKTVNETLPKILEQNRVDRFLQEKSVVDAALASLGLDPGNLAQTALTEKEVKLYVASLVRVREVNEQIAAQLRVGSVNAYEFSSNLAGGFDGANRDAARSKAVTKDTRIRFDDGVGSLTNTPSDILKGYSKAFSDIAKQGAAFGDTFDVTSAQISATESAIKSLLTNGMSPQSEAVQKLIADYNLLTAKQQGLKPATELLAAGVDVLGKFQALLNSQSAGSAISNAGGLASSVLGFAGQLGAVLPPGIGTLVSTGASLLGGIVDFVGGILDPNAKERKALTEGMESSFKSGIQGALEKYRKGELDKTGFKDAIRDSLYDSVFSAVSSAFLDAALQTAGITPLLEEIADAALSGSEERLNNALGKLDEFLASPAFERLVDAGTQISDRFRIYSGKDDEAAKDSGISLVAPITAIDTGPSWVPEFIGLLREMRDGLDNIAMSNARIADVLAQPNGNLASSSRARGV